jgi:hypothetical protein
MDVLVLGNFLIDKPLSPTERDERHAAIEPV